jgi:hypothetical protein
MADDAKPIAIVSCQIIQPELERLCADHDMTGQVRLSFLDQDLHSEPKKMPAIVQEAVDRAAADPHVERVVLGYGLCSNGIVGVRAPRQGLIVPRVHDCVSLVLGSRQAYEQQFSTCPGTYYLTPAWIDGKHDPLGTMESKYAPKLGAELAEWGMREEMAHQSRIALVCSDICPADCARVRGRARENAEFFGKQYEELHGTEDLLRKLIAGPYPEDEFVHVAPGEEVRQNMFL